MSLPTAAEITQKYLYGQNATPNKVSATLIRPQVLTTNPFRDVNTQEFMTLGGGRFAVGRQFEIVNDFFTADSSLLPANTPTKPYYTKAEIGAIFHLSYYGWIMQQYNYQDTTDDYAERSYIYNTQAFKLADDVRFVVNSNGTRRIDNFAVIPDNGTQENFDFNGGGLASLINPLIEPRIDPSNIGRTVNINFTGDVTRTTYDGNSYYNDFLKMNSWSGLSLSKLTTDVNSLIDTFWSLGITKFLNSGNKPIMYGTDNADIKNAADVFIHEDYPTLSSYYNNGVVIIAGKGNDTLLGGVYNDILMGGLGDDAMDGGSGIDTASYQDFENELKVKIVESVSGLASGADTIGNIEKIQGSDYQDRMDITLLANSKVTEIDSGAKDDIVHVTAGSDLPNLVIKLGDGDDIFQDFAANDNCLDKTYCFVMVG